MAVSELSYTAVYEQVENGWTQARIVEVPGVITAGASRDEARDLLRDALREYLASFMENNAGTVSAEDQEELRVELITAEER
jgi:predicted RNase H-like HicB family nuclease